jgi:hypothetical protein
MKNYVFGIFLKSDFFIKKIDEISDFFEKK